MNILLVAGLNITLREPFNSGIEAFIVSLANQLVKDGHVVDVIASNSQPDVLFNTIKLDDRSDHKRRHMIKFSQLDVNKYDIIHYNLFIPELYKIGSQFNKPSVLTLHSPVDRKRVRTYKKFAKSNYVTFVAVSQRVKQQWDSALGVDMQVIHNGIDLERWPLKQTNGDYLFWSARINKEKNVEAAINLASYIGHPLIIAGRITDQGYFNKHVQPFLTNKIQYVGHKTQRELSALAKNASAFLATANWQEPFGLASLEMLASGVHIVGFDSAVPKDLQHDGISTVASNKWYDLIKPLEQIGSVRPEECRSYASTMSIENTSRGYINLYHMLVDTTLRFDDLCKAPQSIFTNLGQI
jgi:UDP-glucose:tetrahydrobiopterin glucosyltransferase